MKAETLQWLKENSRRVTNEAIDGRLYKVGWTPSGPELGAEILAPLDAKLEVQTLTGFVDAYNSKINGFDGEDKPEFLVHVESPTRVVLGAAECVAGGGRREIPLVAECKEVLGFQFGKYYEPQEFIIAVQQAFLWIDGDKNNVGTLVQLASHLTSESSVTTRDDGFTQEIVMKQGAVTKSTVAIPPRISMSAWRTFREAVQPESQYLLRIKGEKDQLPKLALIEVDGNAWKLAAVLNVKKWLEDKLPDATVLA